MKCIAGALVPDTGTIRFADRDLTRAAPSERARAGLSIKFQITSVLPSLSVYDNILLALQGRDSLVSLLRSATRRARHESVMAALERFPLRGRADDLAGALSHGEQQWLEIAMALATDPTLLLLDEPTAGMSLEERRLTGELLVPIKRAVRHPHRRARPRLHPRRVRRAHRARPGQRAGHRLGRGHPGQPPVQEVYLTRV